MTGPNRIEQTSTIRQSTNLSVDRQTPKSDFGDRVRHGLETAAGAVSQGAAIAAPFVPGGAIVSAAVSSVSSLSTSGGAGGGVTGQYASGVQLVGGGTINTTVGAPAGAVTAGQQQNLNNSLGDSATAGGSAGGVTNADLIRSQAENAELLKVQIAMQRENQVFSTMSNVLKTRHDTVKNTVANVR